VALFALERFEDAIGTWREIEARRPANESLQTNIGRAYYRLGGTHAQAGRWADAVAAWEVYLERSPSDLRAGTQMATACGHLAAAALERGPAGLVEARRHLTKAVSHHEAHDAFRYYAALCDLALGDVEAAHGALQALEATWGAVPRLVYHRALCLARLGRRDEAIALWTTLAGRAEETVFGRWAAWALANEYARAGRVDDAATVLARSNLALAGVA
jgi:tetratricopeptide (TPR) repeat protein